jgi:hypothetical protein
MIDEVRFDADVPRQHVRDEPFREGGLVAQQAKHDTLLDDEHGCRRRRGGRPDPNRLTGQCPFPEEISRAQHRHHGFFASPGEHRDLDAALLNVHDGIARLPLREDDCSLGKCRHVPRSALGRKDGFGVESRWSRAWLNASCFRFRHRESSELSHANARSEAASIPCRAVGAIKVRGQLGLSRASLNRTV